MLFDVPLDELEVYRPAVREPADFDAFWQGRLAAAREHPLDPVFDPHPSPIRHADVYDVTFAGAGTGTCAASGLTGSVAMAVGAELLCSRNRRSSTGKGSTRVEFFSAATSTMVSNRRS